MNKVLNLMFGNKIGQLLTIITSAIVIVNILSINAV